MGGLVSPPFSVGAKVTGAVNTVYQAVTDLIVVMTAENDSGGTSCVLSGYSDAANPPTDLLAVSHPVNDNALSNSPDRASGTMVVRKGHYWKVAKAGTGTFQNVYSWPIG